MTVLSKNLIAVSLSVVTVGAANAQELVCGASDEACLTQEWTNSCRAEGATAASCSAWLRALEQSPLAAHPNVQLNAASTHLALAELVEDPEAQAQSRRRATEIYRGLADRDPSIRDAWLGLSLTAETEEERAAMLRQAVQADPTHVRGYEFLARAVSGTDPRTAAEAWETAYALTDNGERRWRFARFAVAAYERAGAQAEAAALRNRVRADLELDRRVAELDRPDASQPARVVSMIEDLCTESIVGLLGLQTCLDAVEKVVDAAKRDPAFMEPAARGMRVVLDSHANLDEADPTWRPRNEEALETFIASGRASADVYRTYAAVTLDSEKRLSIMRLA